MHNMPLRFYLYIAAGVAGLILIVTDPEQRAVSHIATMFQTLADISRTLVAALR